MSPFAVVRQRSLILRTAYTSSYEAVVTREGTCNTLVQLVVPDVIAALSVLSH